MTKARQETIVGEGFALGCVGVGRESFSGQKMSIEFAFEHAWTRWLYRARFPAIRADVQRNSLIGVIDRSPRRRSSRLAGWASEWPFAPYVDENWSPEEVADLLAGECGVPFEGWRQLAQMFLDHLDRAVAQSS
jgi:hypothetical protein